MDRKVSKKYFGLSLFVDLLQSYNSTELHCRTAIFNLFHLMAHTNYQNSATRPKSFGPIWPKNNYNFDSFTLDGSFFVGCFHFFFLI